MPRFSELEAIAGGTLLKLFKDREITNLVVDSRKALVGEGTVFFAITGERHDGHQFLTELYRFGIRQFVIEKTVELGAFPEGNFLYVPSSLSCLQSLVA